MPLSPSATRDLLARLAHQPKRFLGQNFLVDGNIVRKSLELAGVSPDDRVVEVGPGLGTLTSALLEAGAEVFAVERDATLQAYLTAELAPRFPGQAHLLEGDAVESPRAGLPDDGGDFKIVANLPYAISTPWMDAILEGPLPSRLVLMLQLEAAARYGAKPGTKQFGAISIFLQSAYDLAPGHKVAAACFHPRPDVESYLLNLVRKPEPFVFCEAAKTAVRACFQQRRKQVGSLLRSSLGDKGEAWIAELEAAGLGAGARAEQIPVALWQKLDAILRAA
ncbi:MAG: 16S rRNA (adenine(1518)-N(6)/adenine(1519)-N(6))-dimethyltransferase RsmA [Verrucomicrobiota bacterium]